MPSPVGAGLGGSPCNGASRRLAWVAGRQPCLVLCTTVCFHT